MRKKCFDNEQVAAILRERDLGTPMQELSEKYKVSLATLYTWRAEHRYYAFNRDERHELLMGENRRLRQQLLELTIEMNQLRELLRSHSEKLPAAKPATPPISMPSEARARLRVSAFDGIAGAEVPASSTTGYRPHSACPDRSEMPTRKTSKRLPES